MGRKSFLVLIHVSVWLIGLLIIKFYDFLAISYFDYRSFTLFSIVFGTIVNALIFYGNSHVLLPRALTKKLKLSKYVLAVISFVILLSFIEGFTDYLFNKFTNPFWDNIMVEFTFEYFDFTILINFLFLFISFGYGFTLQWYNNEVLKRQLIQDNIQTELNLLKTQVKPHFLFNTLNNIFGLANKNNDPLVANSIAKLADIMRYQTYESKDSKVVLSKEVEYLKNYIDLQKLRFTKGDKIKIEFNVKGDTESFFIDQLILLPLVENAFKHGVSLQSKTEILLNLEIKKSLLSFHVKNTINPSKNKSINEDSGIGLDNLRKRLKLLYPNKSELIIKEDLKYFEVFLELNYEEPKN